MNTWRVVDTVNLPRPTFDNKSGTGFTLLEGVIATGIISTALIVGLSLAYSNLTAAQANSDRIIAAHLAREGIEAVRNMRDSNWLRREANIDKDADPPAGVQFYAWDDFFHGWPSLPDAASCPGGNCYGNYFDVIVNDPNLPSSAYTYGLRKATTNAIPCPVDASQPSCRIRKRGSVYHQASASTDPATPFYRRIILKPICWDGTNEAVVFDPQTPSIACPGTQTRVGMLATSQVVWRRGAKTLEIDAKERFYNWRN